MSVTTKSLSDSTEADVEYPQIEQVAVVITFRQTIELFHEEHSPSKMKWSNLTESDIRRFVYYNIIEQADQNMGTQTVWQLQDWVLTTLDYASYNFNLSGKQIAEITRYADDITSLTNEFVGRDTSLAGRSIGHLHDIGVIEMVEDNRNKHCPTVWKLTDRMEKLCRTISHIKQLNE